LCNIKDAKLVPISQIISGDFGELENLKDKKIVLYCHTGARSAHVLSMLKDKGYKSLKNLVGGIDAWSREIDDQVEIY